jgi:hypothetical protein
MFSARENKIFWLRIQNFLRQKTVFSAVENKYKSIRLEFYARSFSNILYHLTLWIIEIKWLCTILSDEYYVEAAILEHTSELALASTKRYCAGGIIVGDIDGGVLALLVIVVGALVLIELECTILTGIDIEVDELGRLLIAPLHLRTKWDDGTLANEDRYLLVRGIDNEPTAREVSGLR